MTVWGVANKTTVQSEGATLFVSRGGTANDTTVTGGGTVHIEGFINEAGTANNTTINEGGALFVSAFGEATRTTVNAGELHVSNTGSATGNTVNSGGSLIVSSGALALTTSVNEGGALIVSEGGLASNTTLNGGAMYGNNSAMLNKVEVNSGGYLYLYAGVRKAEGIKENGGCVEIERGAEVTFAANTFNGLEVSHSATVHSMTSAVDTTVNARGQFIVFDGGHATGLTVSNYGGLTVYSGAHLGGSMTFRDNAVVNVYSGAFVDFDISRLKPTNTAIVNDLAKIGTAPDFTLTVGGASQTEGDYRLAEGATGFDKSITVLNSLGDELGTLTVNGDSLELDGLNYALTLAGSILTISAWKNVFSGDVTGETKNILSGMSAVNVNVNERGILNISSGGVASSTKVNSGGSMNIFDSGVASNTTVNQGVLHIKSGGVATDTEIYFALAKVSAGGIANKTTVNQDGDLILDHKGVANNTTVNERGHFEVSYGGMAADTTVNKGGHLYVYSGGTATNATVNGGGTAEVSSGGMIDGTIVNSGGSLLIYNGAKLTGRMTFENGAEVIPFVGSILDFDLTQTSPDADALVDDLSILMGKPSYTLTVSGSEANGIYKLAGGAAGYGETITVVNTSGVELGTLTVGQTADIGGVGYALAVGGDNVLSVTVGAVEPAPGGAAKSDINANGISDVMFQYTGGFGQIGFWMDGTSSWQSTNSTHPVDVWEVLGAYDMNANGKADSVLVGNTEISGIKAAFIGYYADAEDYDSNWVNISYLTNNEGYVWKNKVGNLTGNEGMNSIVWHCTDIGALGVWTDGTDNWTGLGAGYDSNWTLVGCGDFAGTGKDAVLMSYMDGAKYYTVGIDGTSAELATSDNGWAVRAIGDFSGDGKDDIVAFHKETGIVAMWGDGNSSNWSQLGQLDAADWFVVGAGDYDGDAKDDLLVRQYSTGMLGYYASGDMSAWTELGRGVDMSWTVIA